MTLTSKIGKFEFSDEITLSMAKLIRDTVMGQILSPPEGTPRLKRNAKSIKAFVAASFKNESVVFEKVVLA